MPKKEKTGKSTFIPSQKNKIAKKTEPKADLSYLVLQTIRKLGQDASLKTVYPPLLKHLSQEQIVRALNRLESQDKISIRDRGKIFLVQSGAVSEELFGHHTKASSKGKEYEGIVDITKTGAGYVMVDGLSKDVYVPGKFTKRALKGDRVKVRVHDNKKGRPEGEILQIIKRSQESFVGSIEVFDKFAFFKPDERNLRTDFFIPLDRLAGAKDKDRAIARVTDWNDKGKNPVAEIAEVMDPNARDNDRDMKLILIQAGFHTEFPHAAIEELNKIPDAIPAAEIAKRLDYRKILTFTIDPIDAKDFDDAISYRKLENGNHEIGVHIADVSHYIKVGSVLDKEAERRATSVYLPDRVCPMLPERLSNFLCSLRPNEDKLAFSTIFEMDEKFEIVNTTIAKTVIHSVRRYAYEDVQEILESGAGDNAEVLLLLNRISKTIRAKRFKNGAIGFEKEEVRFQLDEKGKPLGLIIKVRKDAHLLIEDFMLLANETIAKFGSKLKLGKHPSAFVYRVHDKPDETKLAIFALMGKRFGYSLQFDSPKEVAPKLNDLLKKIEGKPEQHILENLAIRSMAKAEYTTKNIGHYGLAMDFYTHFTSPIRRYPDVMVHRLVYESLSDTPHLLDKETLEAYCKNSSLMERKANEAEREAVRYKQVEFLMDKVGEEFEGIIVGVIARGFFVEMIANKCEGMVSTDSLGYEDFVYDETRVTLTGRNTGRVFRLGDKVNVQLVRADLAQRKIDLELIAADAKI